MWVQVLPEIDGKDRSKVRSIGFDFYTFGNHITTSKIIEFISSFIDFVERNKDK